MRRAVSPLEVVKRKIGSEVRDSVSTVESRALTNPGVLGPLVSRLAYMFSFAGELQEVNCS